MLDVYKRQLKDKFGPDIETIFIGPCIAKKLEADRHPDLLSLSLSFSDLRQWLKDEDIDPATIKPGVFDVFTPEKAKEGTAYPIEGGMIETLKPYPAAAKAYMMQITGIYNIERELDNLQDTAVSRPVFIECLACDGGCVNGPCTTNKKSGPVSYTHLITNVYANPSSNTILPTVWENMKYREPPAAATTTAVPFALNVPFLP